jgi:hypothetical protein
VTITAGVVDHFFVPPPNLLTKSVTSPVALSNPYSGSGNVLAVSGGVQAYGLHWAVNSAPPEAGTTGRSVLIYLEPYMSFSVHYVLADASDFIGETVLSGAAEGFHLFHTARAASVAYHILPGWTVHLDWLINP